MVQPEPQLVQTSTTPTYTSSTWGSECLVHLGAGSQWSKVPGRTPWRCPVICVCMLKNIILEPWIRNHLLYVFLLVKHRTNPGICGQHGGSDVSVLLRAAHTCFWSCAAVSASVQSFLKGINNLRNILFYWYFTRGLVRQGIFTNISQY